MCTEIEVEKSDGRPFFVHCSTKGELERALGGPVVDEYPEMPWRDDECLCPCDLEKTAQLYGYVARPDPETGGMVIRFARPTE